MDRRSFLKVLGVASVAPVVVAKVFEEPEPRVYRRLEPNYEPLSEGVVPTGRSLTRVADYDRLFFGSNRSGKTESHALDCMGYARWERVRG